MADGDRGRKRERADVRAEARAERKRSQGDLRRKRASGDQDHLPLERANLVLFAVALAVIVIGYLTLAGGSITLAPILLVLGYCVLVPVAIVYRPRRRTTPEEGGGGEAKS
jgi:Flp pilus assembly protein TadB